MSNNEIIDKKYNYGQYNYTVLKNGYKIKVRESEVKEVEQPEEIEV